MFFSKSALLTLSRSEGNCQRFQSDKCRAAEMMMRLWKQRCLKKTRGKKKKKKNTKNPASRWNQDCDSNLFSFPKFFVEYTVDSGGETQWGFKARHSWWWRRNTVRIRSQAEHIPLCFSIRPYKTKPTETVHRMAQKNIQDENPVAGLEVQAWRRRSEWRDSSSSAWDSCRHRAAC